MDARKPGAIPMHERMAHHQKNETELVKVTGDKNIMFILFKCLSMIPRTNPAPNHSPIFIDKCRFDSFEFLGSPFNHDPQRPHIASGEYKSNDHHFKFQLRKMIGKIF